MFMGMLYFKSLMVSSGRRTSFRRKNRKSPCIAGIRDKTFVLIDDCADRGWERLLRELIEAESAACCTASTGSTALRMTSRTLVSLSARSCSLRLTTFSVARK